MDDTKEDDRRLVAGRRYGQVQDDDRDSRGKHHSHGGPELKPEADPGWEERKAERKAKKAHLVSPGSTSSPHSSPEMSKKSPTTTTSHPPPTLIRCGDIGSANRAVPGLLTSSLYAYVRGRNARQERRADVVHAHYS